MIMVVYLCFKGIYGRNIYNMCMDKKTIPLIIFQNRWIGKVSEVVQETKLPRS